MSQSIEQSKAKDDINCNTMSSNSEGLPTVEDIALIFNFIPLSSKNQNNCRKLLSKNKMLKGTLMQILKSPYMFVFI